MAQNSMLQDILRERVGSPSGGNILLYPLGGSSRKPDIVSYSQLYAEASKQSIKLQSLSGFNHGSPILLHLEDHWDNIVWFWAVLLANCIPVLSPPFSNVRSQRSDYLKGLSELLGAPICIVRNTSLGKFEGIDHSLQLNTVESLLGMSPKDPYPLTPTQLINPTTTNGSVEGSQSKPDRSSLAILMLTSGTTGNAKAVRLTHQQILAAVSGKASIRPSPPSSSFLNWIGVDHVAGLIEIHILALWLGVDQVHVNTADVMASPEVFLDLLSRHRVSRSFAPNFFLAKLVARVSSVDKGGLPTYDLSTLNCLISGGEANDVSTCIALSELFEQFGAPGNVLVPGFGMTETCAGAIYNTECPNYDVSGGRSMASLGQCIPGIEMRITVNNESRPAAPGETAELELRGIVVFDGYYRNPSATTAAFTSDGWFRTGDHALIDSNGKLHLTGRSKDVINIGGVKIPTPDVQGSVEAALRNKRVSRVVCFPSRAPGAASEQVTVAYSPISPISAEELSDIDKLIAEACMMVSTACRPHVFSITDQSLHLVPTSTLGKISTAKMRILLESGAFDGDIEIHRSVIVALRQKHQASTDAIITKAESLLQLEFAETLGIEDSATVDIETPLFELGFSSMDLIHLKLLIDARLGTTVDIVLLLKHPTIRSLAAALDRITNQMLPPNLSSVPTGDGDVSSYPDTLQVSDAQYDPVVVLRPKGSKVPLWLLHPGIGEILVFVGVAKHMRDDDRPIYALRARGLEPGQSNFTSIDEIVSIYVKAIRRVQPEGPYALAGYSYGAMLAFEIAKCLESAPETEVRFLGDFNLPPQIRTRMRQLEWNMCLLHLAQFLDLVSEEYADKESLADRSEYRDASRETAVETVLSLAGKERMSELGMTPADLIRWTNTAYALPSVATNYEPSGDVQSMDIFHAEPLKILRVTRQQWISERLSEWRGFCRTSPRFHEVGGTHYSMLGPDHIVHFSEKLKEALKARGI
ncbi:acetyl-CoA synthetase-like protein [Xylaria arbuscula]|nr:acetyl-CoA synthetase-like protein [Xylaria arbuscula]